MVTAIIVALLAIMFPLLSAAKRQSLSSQETSQLRQLAVAHGVYLPDHDDTEPGSATRIIAGGYAPSHLVNLALDPFAEGWANYERKKFDDKIVTNYKDSFRELLDVTSDGLFNRFVESTNGGWLISAGHNLVFYGENVMLQKVRYKRLTFGGSVVVRTFPVYTKPSPDGGTLTGIYSDMCFTDDDVLKEFRR